MFWGHSIHYSLTLPASMFNLKSLKELDLSYRSIEDGSLPDDLGGLPSLRKLDLSGNMLKNLPAGCISNLLKLEFLFLNSCSELGSLPQLLPSLTTVDAGECASLETVADEQLLQLFASIDQALTWIAGNETLSVTIPGSEIPSWFENRNDLCVDNNGIASMKIDMPTCEEILGIGLCIVLDEKFNSTEPGLIKPTWCFDFAYSWSMIPGRNRGYGKEIKSSHLWIMFWKQREELGHMLQLSKYNHIPLTFAVHGGKLDAQVLFKCGWRVIRKGDFENSSSSIKNRSSPISQSLLSTLNQESTMFSDDGEQGDECFIVKQGEYEAANFGVDFCEMKLSDGSWNQFITKDARHQCQEMNKCQ